MYLLPTNLYGPGDHTGVETSHVIPAMIVKFSAAVAPDAPTVSLWGDGSPTRDFLHVDDAARGFSLALAQYDEAAPLNLGSGDEISIGDLARLVAELTGFTGRIEWEPTRPNGQPRRRLDTSAARKAFGFEATIALRDGIAETIGSMHDTTG